MSTESPLLIDLAGIARLADVQRPVASMWRSRFSATDDPFPSRITERDGRPYFDALEVAGWLTRTGHGNNREVMADAAASAHPEGFDIANSAHVAGVDALLTVRAATGATLHELDVADLQRLAKHADPADDFLGAELVDVDPAWVRWADLLADAAYSPLEASRLLERRHDLTRAADGSAGPLSANATTLLERLTHALTVDEAMLFAPAGGVGTALATSVIARTGAEIDLSACSASAGRSIRRRLICEGNPVAPSTPQDTPQLSLLRLPADDTPSTTEMLRTIDDLALTMRDEDRSIVVAPTSVLVDALDGTDSRTRADILRSGRIRAIAALPTGLVTSAPRESLALMVLGREVGDVPIAERFTAIADLRDTALTAAARGDLISDLAAAMGSRREVLGHAFRFTSLVRTSSLLASRGALIAGSRQRRSSAARTADLPALIDQAYATLGDDAPVHPVPTGESTRVADASVEALIHDGHLRVLGGTRIDPQDYTTSGLAVVHADDLDDLAHIGARHVDALAFAAQHPSARLSAPGDVIFRTGPSPRAWVDIDGSKVVAYPARILRITAGDPGGLVAHLVATDIAHSTGGPGAWRRWMLRRVPPSSAATLRTALTDLGTRRADLERRLKALDDYTDLLTAGIVAGVVTLPDNAAAAASEPL